MLYSYRYGHDYRYVTLEKLSPDIDFGIGVNHHCLMLDDHPTKPESKRYVNNLFIACLVVNNCLFKHGRSALL